MSAYWFNPAWTTLRVFGPDAISWLNGIVTCDVQACVAGDTVWGALLTKQGKVLAEFHVLYELDSLYLVIAGGDPALALKVLDGLLVMEDAEVESSSRAFCWVTGESAQEEMTRLGLSGHPSAVFAQPAFLVGMEPGALVELQATEDRLWWNPQQFEQLRIMSHVPRFGVDYDDHDNLHAAGLERKVVSWSKGCYLGQEVVCMQEMRGKVRRNVVALTLDQPVTEQLPLALKNSAGEVVGQCTSLFGTTALAKVTAPENQTGTRLDLASVDQVRLTSAVVVS